MKSILGTAAIRLDVAVRKLDMWALKYPRRTVLLMALAALVVCIVANGRG